MLSKDSRLCAKLILSMENNGEWLDKLLADMNWKPADLSRATGLDSAVISNIRSGKRGLGIDTAKLIAKATKRSPENILRMAGEFPKVDIDEWVEEMNHKMGLLDHAKRPMAERLLNALLEEDKPIIVHKKARAKS